MQEKSLVGAKYKYNGKDIKILHQDPSEVYFAMLKADGTPGPKQRMDWPTFKKEVIGKNDSKVRELLNVLEVDPNEEDDKDSVEWEWQFEFKGKKVFGGFHFTDPGKSPSGGAPSRDSLDPYGGEGEMPVLELVALHDENDQPVVVTPEEKEQIESEAAEKRWEEMGQE